MGMLRNVSMFLEGVLLGPEYRTESLRTESISSSPSPVLPSTPMTTGHSKTGSKDSYTQTEKGQSQNQDSSKPSTPALQSMTLPARLSSPSPVYIPDRFAGEFQLILQLLKTPLHAPEPVETKSRGFRVLDTPHNLATSSPLTPETF